MKRLILSFLLILPLLTFSQTKGFVKNEVLIQVKSNDVLAFENELHQSTFDYREINFRREKLVSKNLHVWLYQFDSDVNHKVLLENLYKNQFVLSAQNNHFVDHRETTPDDLEFASQWHHINTGQTSGTVDADIDTPEAWDITSGGVSAFGDTIVACILEGNGGLLTHPDLIDNAWHNYNEIPNNGIDDDQNGYIDDYNGWNINADNDDIGTGNHGTQVASMIGAKGNNNLGVSGVNWNVKLMMVRGQSASNEASVLEAYDYPLTMRKLYNSSNGQKGAFIVVTNASWGVDGGNPDDFPLWDAMYDSLGKYGVLNVGATTNGFENVEVVGDMPTQSTSDYLIGVTSTGHADTIVSAGYGTISIDLAAPGRNVYLANNGGGYGNANGTSFASPCVAGAIALMYSVQCPSFMTLVKNDPQAAADMIRAELLAGVDPIPQLASQTVTGGRLNVFNSVNSLITNCDFSSCVPPYSLGIENNLDISTRLTWEGFSNDYLIDWRAVGDVNWTRELSSTNFFDLSGLTKCTDYEFQVYSDCGTDTSGVSQLFTFKTDGCCINPALNIDNSSNTSLTIEWPSVLAANSYDIRYKDSGTSIWTDANNEASPLFIDNLDTCTQYDIEIRINCDDGTEDFSNLIQPTTTGCGACLDSTYCTSSGNVSFEYLDSVIIESISNGSGANGGYASFEDVQTTFGPNSTYEIKLIPGYTNFNYTERFLVYIDFDQNGEFNTSDELVLNESNNGPLTSTISTPSTFTPGLTKMRVLMIGGNNSSTACPSGNYYGEMEDYCVQLDLSAGINEINSDLEFQVFPNPTKDFIYVNFANSESKKIQIHSISGQVIRAMESHSSLAKLDLSGLPNGVYFLHVQSESNSFGVKKIIVNK